MARVYSRAFSLFEISIALIVISTILAVTFNMRSLISNHEIKHIMSELHEYKNSLKSFYQIYNDAPGDMGRGYKLFGDSNCTNSVNDSFNNTGCNGNQNHSMDYDSDRNNTDGRETILAWYHLYKAEFINFNNRNDMNFNNKNASELLQCNSIVQNIGHNVPSLKIRDAGILITQYNISEEGYRYQMSLSVKKGVACNLEDYMGIFTNEEIEIIDRKYDNGNISSGSLNTATSTCLNCDLQYKITLGTNI